MASKGIPLVPTDASKKSMAEFLEAQDFQGNKNVVFVMKNGKRYVGE